MPSAVRTEIAGVSVVDLARRFGTPTYVYDAAMIRRRLAELAAFDVVRYAQKACSNLAVLDLVRRCGALVDAVSGGEIRRALSAGFPPQGEPPPIVYTADIFDAEALDLCVQYGIHVNCGSPDMIVQYAGRNAGKEITLRINPGFGHGHSRKTNTGGKQSKHGIWHEQLTDCLAMAERFGLTVVGLHAHIGSGSDLEHLSQVCDALERAALLVGPKLRSLNVGGGLPVVYRPGDKPFQPDAYFAVCDAFRKRLENRFQHPLRLEIEPGRYIVAESGFLIAEIRAVKRQDDNLFYLLDAGFNNLARPVLYGAYHPMSLAPVDGNTKRKQQSVIIGGPLCESGDIFTQRSGGYVVKRRLPAAQVGDYLVIECAGAYGFTMSSNYNSRPLAAEVLIDEGRPMLIRRRQTFEDLVQDEEIPSH